MAETALCAALGNVWTSGEDALTTHAALVQRIGHPQPLQSGIHEQLPRLAALDHMAALRKDAIGSDRRLHETAQGLPHRAAVTAVLRP